jgi:hypothetical protein
MANILDIRQVLQAWPTAEPLLRQAISGQNQSASGPALCFPQGVPLRADRLSKKDLAPMRGCGCCSASESHREHRMQTFRTPWIYPWGGSVERRGFAIRVRKSRSPSRKVQEPIRKLLDDESAKAKAASFAKTIARWDGRRAVAQKLLEH